MMITRNDFTDTSEDLALQRMNDYFKTLQFYRDITIITIETKFSQSLDGERITLRVWWKL